MYALIGIVMLMGLVTKNAILLVEYCLTAMKKGMTREQAIFSAGNTRMRPILMTTTAMIAGMLPIAAGLGAGAEARSPMAIAVVGGLFMSTLLTLVVVPVVFTYMDDLQKFIVKFFHNKDAAEDRQQRESTGLMQKQTRQIANEVRSHVKGSSSEDADADSLQQVK
jgi:predicted RND superfamily exporter protein